MEFNSEHIKSIIRIVPDFPKKGIHFYDIFPLFQNPAALESVITHITDHIKAQNKEPVDAIVGLDARGFLFGALVCARLGVPFVPVRKAGKLPGQTVQVCYTKEYGQDVFEMQSDAIKPGQKVVVIDDLIATGGSALAAGELVAQLGGQVVEFIFMIELEGLDGTAQLKSPVYSLFKCPC
ncbi:adenine phosphoribosyltransferase [Dimargaris cristalligena]|uniref:adenine phosphoribosyltransferase n=1 Tax=Dimargaris cristalligena TaxID=215637 RepID=A0A4P9ZTJ7_9FUNG|nr:adenine phosphoribosyltransferase [Dimargaris cristalligena]|eukprot:RKP36904.1 adenine phosphoribosyltransferase [Dimargaris cristalligena]